MTRQHYKAIADILATADVYGDDFPGRKTRQLSLAMAFADYLATDDPQFDRARFLTACGHP